jgi:hypothetical protein
MESIFIHRTILEAKHFFLRPKWVATVGPGGKGGVISKEARPGATRGGTVARSCGVGVRCK